MQIQPVEQLIDEEDDIVDVDDEVPDTQPVEFEDDEPEEPRTDEEMTILLKSPEEREEIEDEIADLEDAVPQLTEDYKIVDRLGTGTFSSVYKALDISYEAKWHNSCWQGRHPPSSSARYQSTPPTSGSKVFVAIKRIYVTSNPERIRNEIMILEDCRGARHVSQLITAFRHRDQVVAVMPYHHNDDFRDFYRTLPMSGVKAYFRCLLRALRDIHARGVIHRDVKPANFLFDSRTYIGTLCDFGLACRVDLDAKHGHCLHTPPSREYLHGQKKSGKLIDTNLVKAMQRDARQKGTLPSDRVGYLEKDLRPHSKANRAGTRGFRAPEVLLKCNDQTGAIDIWSAGMILLFFLTGKFPLFQSNDDIEALMEIAAIIGKRRMESAATLHNRTFATNVPAI
ncbi:kinase-like protein, partial [Fomitiporia mediterranea MF3/22]|uniref:kinase-like protein n=1 Tax=Fomitiporia mediterranea (strain MF3/22) TaxID=694068 RepID=UPI000440793C